MAGDLKCSRDMSKHNNVNPGQYKVGGRLHPGDDDSRQEHDKAQASVTDQELREEARRHRPEDQARDRDDNA